MIRETTNKYFPTVLRARTTVSLAAALLLTLLAASCSEPPLVEDGKQVNPSSEPPLVEQSKQVSPSNEPPLVEDGKQVSLLYEATDESGAVVDVNPDEGPLVFVVGRRMLQPKIEAELIGLRAGEEKTFTIPDAYGEHNPKKTGTLTRKALAADVVPKVGDVIPMSGGLPAKILEVNDRYMVIDLNHPLAGKAITFAVKVVEVKDPEPPGAEPEAAEPPPAPPAASQPPAAAAPAAEPTTADPPASAIPAPS